MSSLCKAFLGLLFLLPGLCFPKGELIVNGDMTAYDVKRI